MGYIFDYIFDVSPKPHAIGTHTHRLVFCQCVMGNMVMCAGCMCAGSKDDSDPKLLFSCGYGEYIGGGFGGEAMEVELQPVEANISEALKDTGFEENFVPRSTSLQSAMGRLTRSRAPPRQF